MKNVNIDSDDRSLEKTPKKDDISYKVMKIFLLIGFAFLSIRALVWTDSFHTGLLYILVPFSISVILLKFSKPIEKHKSKVRNKFRNLFREGTIIMLGTSIFLMEGFVCVLMFMPIYYAGLLMAFIFDYWLEKAKTKKGKLGAYAIPVIALFASLEGTHQQLTHERYNEVSFTKIIDGTPAELQQNMAMPMELPNKRHWFLKTFPLPDEIEANSLKQGDIHRLHFTYNRWFFTNTHKGEMHVKLTEVSDNRVKTEIIRNDSYLANYMKIHGTQVDFEQVDENKTAVTITISFDRLIDPFWYFEPLERFAAEKSAEYLIERVIERKS